MRSLFHILMKSDMVQKNQVIVDKVKAQEEQLKDQPLTLDSLVYKNTFIVYSLWIGETEVDNQSPVFPKV